VCGGWGDFGVGFVWDVFEVGVGRGAKRQAAIRPLGRWLGVGVGERDVPYHGVSTTLKVPESLEEM
jgi:hypothetical protein